MSSAIKAPYTRKCLHRSLDAENHTILRSHRNIVQHAHALTYIDHEMIMLNELLSKELILEAHKSKLRDGDTWYGAFL